MAGQKTGVTLASIPGVAPYKGTVFKPRSPEDVLNMLNMLCKGGGGVTGIKKTLTVIKESSLYLLHIQVNGETY